MIRAQRFLSRELTRPRWRPITPRLQSTLVTEDDDPCPVTYEDVSRAMYRIRSGVRYTPCDFSDFISEICETTIYFKKDFMQYTGSFKERGGRNSLMLLSNESKREGVVTASAGNHALALAYHGKSLSIPVTTIMPRTAPLAKVEKCRKLGRVLT